MFARLMRLCLMTMLLQGCTPNTTENDKWCDEDGVITVSPADKFTIGTARQILIHNDEGRELCVW